MKLLLISNSTMPGETYFSYPQPYIKDFLGATPLNIVFIPFAGVTFSFDEYEQKVQEQIHKLGHKVTGIHHFSDYKKALQEADAIMVGGGNTWHLTRLLHQHDLVEIVRERVLKNNIPYIGWSAGSNVACPTIKTTNDMPIVDPTNFNVFGLVPFQINPHYTDLKPKGHGGESREDRINEFIVANPDMYVLGLREGSMLWIENGKVTLKGDGQPCRVFKNGEKTAEHTDLSRFSF